MSIILEPRTTLEANFVKRLLTENHINFREIESEGEILQVAIHEVQEIRKGKLKGISPTEFWESVHAD